MPPQDRSEYYVYVLALTEDPKIIDALVGFYRQIEEKRRNKTIPGLINIHPLRPGSPGGSGIGTLDVLLPKTATSFRDAIILAPLEGLAMLSEWESGEAIDAFCGSQLHGMLTAYAYKKTSGTILKVLQYRNGTIRSRDISGKIEG